MQQNLSSPSFYRRRYVCLGVVFMVTSLVVALGLMSKLVILSKNAKHDVNELLNTQTTRDNDSNRSTMITSTVEGTQSHETTMSSANYWMIDSYLLLNRTNFAAVVLENGEILISGGMTSTAVDYGQLSSTEIYSPVDRKWRAVANMQLERSFHTLTLLQNKKQILAIGCFVPLDSYTGEIYDIEMNRWTYIPSIMDVGRFSHSATLLENGQVLIVGGKSVDYGPQASVQLYDPSSNTFVITSSLNTARYGHTATLLKDGLWVIVIGGGNTITNSISTAEVYVSGFWYYTPGNMNFARRNHATVLLPSGNVLIAGGVYINGSILSSVEIYDASTYTFSLTKSMTCARAGLTLTLLPSGKVLAAGGFGWTTDECVTVSELYDPITGEWTNTRLLNSLHYEHVTVLLNNSVLLIGGYANSTTPLNECERYDL